MKLLMAKNRKSIIMQFGEFGNQMFEQMQKAQENLSKMQEELKNKQVEGSSGGGKVIATVNGRQELVKIVIDPEVVDSDPEEVALLEDMVVAAINQAMKKSQSLMQGEMGKLTGGLDLNSLNNMMPGGMDLNNLMNMFKK